MLAFESERREYCEGRGSQRMSDETSQLKRALLSAVEEGRIAVEDLVDAAFEACGEGVRLQPLQDLVSWADEKPKRRIYVRRPPLVQGQEWEEALAQAREHLSVHPDVESIGWGRTFSGGTANDQVGVIVRVRAKRDVAPDRAIPRHVDVEVGGMPFRLRVDVREVGVLNKQMGLRVGGETSVRSGGRRGTLSAVVSDEGRHRALISGHVAGVEGAHVAFRTRDGKRVHGVVRWHRDNPDIDAAAVRGLSDLDAVLLGRKADLISEFESLEGLLVTVHGATTQRDIEATITDASAVVAFPGGHMRGLLELDVPASVDGDSGAPAVDSRGKLVGFVVGADERGRTHLVLARKVIDASR